MNYLIIFLLLALGILLTFPGGTWLCRCLLKNVPKSPTPSENTVILTPDQEEQRPEIRVGWKIGYLERFIIVFASVIGAWEIFAVVAALKTISRYKELDQKISAEYFLIGSLTSMAWALVCGFLLKKMASTFEFPI